MTSSSSSLSEDALDVPPDHFTDEEVILILSEPKKAHSYFLSMGLLLKSRRAMLRFLKRNPALAERVISTALPTGHGDLRTSILAFQKIFFKCPLPPGLKEVLGEAYEMKCIRYCSTRSDLFPLCRHSASLVPRESCIR